MSLMETKTPFRFRKLANKFLITNEVGDFDFFDVGVLERYFSDELEVDERRRLRELSIIIDKDADWRVASLMRRARQHNSSKRHINYLILIPTLRCDLSCSYCQVSRAPIEASGFDWGKEELRNFEHFISEIEGDEIKIEFQGGEPTLRTDILNEIISICESHFKKSEFVVCSNLSKITPQIEEIFQRENVVVSTSIDGTKAMMTKNRTGDDVISGKMIDNFHYIKEKYGNEKISALPTITEAENAGAIIHH